MTGPNFRVGSKVKFREGWYDAGKIVRVVGRSFFYDQFWTPVVFDGDDDPSLIKSAALEKIGRTL